MGKKMTSSLEWKDRPVKYLRDKVVEQLKASYAKDHLELEEFEQLVQLALSTQSKSELLSLTADLPESESPVVRDEIRELSAYRDVETISCFLSENRKKGIWVPSKQLNITTVMGDSIVDFRGAEMKEDVIYIQLKCWMGATRIIVPPTVNVITNVKSIMASMDSDSSQKWNPDFPTLVIEGNVVMGEVKIEVK